MNKRALLIGCQTGGLRGTKNDIEAMTNALTLRGFTTITTLLDGTATRKGILEAYQKVIDQTQANDCVLIYYSGHGARGKNPEYDQSNPTKSPAYHQFIVPTDINDSSDTDFRGITNHELSHFQNRLTARTRNVIVVLDCCHSALMSRSLDQFIPKAIPDEWSQGIASHLQQLRSDRIDVSGSLVGNRDAVRVVACGPNQSAYEYNTATGSRMGILTESLCLVLNEAGQLENVDWRSLGVRLRERTQNVYPGQLPVIEGPASRLLFDLEKIDHTDVLHVVNRDDKWILEGGRIFGINIGDEYAILPMGSPRFDENKRMATAIVTSVEGASSGIRIEYHSPDQKLSGPALAFPVARAAKRFPVKIIAKGTEGGGLSEAVATDVQLKLAEDIDENACPTARVADGQIKLYDNTDDLVQEGKPNDQKGIEDTVGNLRTLGKAAAMRNLSGGEGTSQLDAQVEIVWGRVEDGVEHPLPMQGDAVHVGESVFFRVINRSHHHIWVSLFDVGLAAERKLINGNPEPLGVELDKNEDYTIGVKGKPPQEITLEWVPGLPEGEPRLETVVIVVMDRGHDLRPLAGAGLRSATKGLGGDSELQRLLEQIDTGGKRDLGYNEPLADLKYDVHHINFFVDPLPMGFLLNETPDEFPLEVAAKSFTKSAPRKVAVCLTDLIIHKNRAFGTATIRVDTMVISKSAANKNPNTWQQTIRFPRISDGEALPFGKHAIYVGEVEDFLTFGVWVSRDTEGSQDLAKLFEANLSSNKFKKAATMMATLAVAGPQAVLGVAAVGAASTLLSMGYQLLSETLPKSIGLYTTSFLQSDRFGVGKHPPSGLLDAQDYSFGYIISDE